MLTNLSKDLKGDELAEKLIGVVTKTNANRLEEFRAMGALHSYCCAQTNPCEPCNTEYMIEQAKRYATNAKEYRCEDACNPCRY